MTTIAHITTPPRHPLVDAWIDAGTLVDAVYATLCGSVENVAVVGYRSFADTFSSRMVDIDGLNIVAETTAWTASVEQVCLVTKPVMQELLRAVERRAEVAAEVLQAQQRNFREDAVAELYRVYLDNFIEYLTPSLKHGKVVGNHIVDPYVVRSRHGTYTDATMLRAQAQGVVDAIAAEHGKPTSLPRTLDNFCEHLGVVRK